MTTLRTPARIPATPQSTPAIVQSLGDSIVDRPSAGAKLARQLFDDVRPTLQRAPEGGRMVVVSAHHRLDEVTRLAQYYQALGKPFMAAHLSAAAALSELHPLADVATAVAGCEAYFDFLPEGVKAALHAQMEALRLYDVALDATPELDAKLKARGEPSSADVRKASYRVAAQKIDEALKAGDSVFELGRIHARAEEAGHAEIKLLASAALQLRCRELDRNARATRFLADTGEKPADATHDDLMQALSMLRDAAKRPVVEASEVKASALVSTQVAAPVAAVAQQAPADKEAALRDACKIGDLAAVKRLIADEAVNINEMGAGKRTALWWACANGHVNVVKALLAAGARKDAKTFRGQSPFWIACANGHLEVAKALRAAGIAVRGDKDGRGVSPLQAAYDNGRANVAKWFFQLGIEND